MQKIALSKSTFKLIEGSNYKITDSYKYEYVVDFSQFKRIAASLFKTDADAITINDTILFRRYIYKIAPTKELTIGQRMNKPIWQAPEKLPSALNIPKWEEVKRTKIKKFS